MRPLDQFINHVFITDNGRCELSHDFRLQVRGEWMKCGQPGSNPAACQQWDHTTDSSLHFGLLSCRMRRVAVLLSIGCFEDKIVDVKHLDTTELLSTHVHIHTHTHRNTVAHSHSQWRLFCLTSEERNRHATQPPPIIFDCYKRKTQSVQLQFLHTLLRPFSCHFLIAVIPEVQ